MYEFLTFRKMVAPVIIQVLFWIGVCVSVIVGLVMTIGGIVATIREGAGGLVLIPFGLFYLLIGPILCRVYAEVLILLFRIYEALLQIRDNTRGLGGGTGGPVSPANIEPPA